MTIQQATATDFAEICTVYAAARQFMVQNGNPTQWQDGYPPNEAIQQDIAQGQCFVCRFDSRICAVFMTGAGPDAAYSTIAGAWQNDAPYYVIHRVASNGSVAGVLAACIGFCKQNALQSGVHNLRIDTHANNRPMRHLLAKHGFAHCGTVCLPGIGERLAYQLAF